MGALNERNALIAVVLAGFVLRLMLIYPFGHLLGEDSYFHQDLVRFMLEGNGLAQYNIGGWELSHPYFLTLAPKIQAYPFGYHILVYPFAYIFGSDAFRYLPVVISSTAPVFVYLFMKEFSGRGDVALMAAVIYSVPDVVAHSILLLPQGLGILFLPLTLWLYLRTEHGGVAGGLFFFVHPFTGIAIMVAMFTLGLWRHEGRKVLRTALLCAIVIASYSLLTILTSEPGSTFSFNSPRFVIYGANKYVSALSLSLLFPMGLAFMRRSDYYLALVAFMFGFMSLVQISNLPPERLFSFLAFFLSCITAFFVRGLYVRGSKAIFAAFMIVLTLMASTDILGNIGPSFIEVGSWEFVNENTLEDSVVWGWDRYPQIFTSERKIAYGPEYIGVGYICPDSHMLGSKALSEYLLSDHTNVIYDNYLPIMTITDD